jgi:hypothetical protein
MKHLISREDYIAEYFRVSKNIEQDDELNEGLLGKLFGGLKMLLKKDWASVKCKNPSVLKYLQEMDKSLSGYTMTKMEFSGECTTIRQNVADYFCDILDYKLNQVEKGKDPNKFLDQMKKDNEENKDSKNVTKKLGVKDQAVIDSIEKYKENISKVCSASPKLREYADQMLNSVEIFVNNQIVAALEKKKADKEKLKMVQDYIKEQEKKFNDIKKAMDDAAGKASEDEIKKISKERDDAMQALGVKPIGAMEGIKAVETITSEFSKIIKEFEDIKLNESALPQSFSKILKSDVYLGITNSLERIDWNTSKGKNISNKEYADRFVIRLILNKINDAFAKIAENKKFFDGVPSASVQAMLVGISNAIIYGFMGDKFDIEKDENVISLLTKCAIDSDATIGFNLPLIDAAKPKNGNFFVSIMNALKNTSDINKEGIHLNGVEANKKLIQGLKIKIKDLENVNDQNKGFEDWLKSKLGDFKQNMTHLFDVIVKKATELKETAKKERESEASTAQQQSESEEKK